MTNYNLPTHKFYPVKISLPKKALNPVKPSTNIDFKYYGFHYDCYEINDMINLVDFKKTKITAETPAMTNAKVEVNTWQEFRKIKEKNGALYEEIKKYTKHDLPLKGYFEIVDSLRRQIFNNMATEEIVFAKGFDYSLDLFEVPNFSWMTYVSERLMNKLKEEKVTGLIFSKPGERLYLAKRPNPKLTWT